MARTLIHQLLALVCFLQLGLAVKEWNDLRVRYSPLKSKGYHKIPLTKNSSEFGEYVKTEPEADFNLPLDFYCYPDDPRACFMFDRKGNVAGVQFSFLKDDVANVKPDDYDISKLKNFKETNFFNVSAYSYRAYFTNPEKLTENGRQSMNETAEGIWVYLDGELYEIPRYQPSTPVYEGFYQQGCVRSMGQHYFYKMDKNLTDCKKYFPLFSLYEDTNLVAIGLATVGKGSTGPKRDWYERPPRLALNFIVPSRPSCLDDLAKNYGLISMHVYLIDKPWKIACKFIDNIINEATDWLPIR
ncbi:uncharacterized protein [Halyomorpha halys]|uniref:uncharacterized protein n=1 Tax=Halyomorpha halys TaxID=286706 RepID=UPI0006D52592|nr:uncharacterized protein LOC106688386 [Halyomorpha halys]